MTKFPRLPTRNFLLYLLCLHHGVECFWTNHSSVQLNDGHIISKRFSVDPGAAEFSPGSLPAPRIVGGKTADVGEFPSIVRLWYAGCAGIIIHKNWVLTVAHCVEGHRSPLERNHSLSAGRHDIGQRKEPNEQIVYVQHTYIHQNYKPDVLYNDIALLQVSPSFQFNEFVKAEKLPPTDLDATGQGTVIGWGSTCPRLPSGKPDNGQQPGCASKPPDLLLKKANLPILTNEDCKSYYPLGIFDTSLCAGSKEGAIGTCDGDSGGPLYVSEGEELLLAGIVSWGVGCAQKNNPGVYTRLSKYRRWIRDTMADRTLTCKKLWGKK